MNNRDGDWLAFNRRSVGLTMEHFFKTAARSSLCGNLKRFSTMTERPDRAKCTRCVAILKKLSKDAEMMA